MGSICQQSERGWVSRVEAEDLDAVGILFNKGADSYSGAIWWSRSGGWRWSAKLILTAERRR